MNTACAQTQHILALAASLAIHHTASAQPTDTFESIVWGANMSAGPENNAHEFVCDLQPNTSWSGTMTAQGSPAGDSNAFTYSGHINYTLDPSTTHSFDATFTASGHPSKTAISSACLSSRFTIQVITNAPFTFESAAHAVINPNAIFAGTGVGVIIHAAPQRWIIGNQCNLATSDYIDLWDADTSVIILSDRADQVIGQPLESHLEPGVTPDPTAQYLEISGLGTTIGTLPAGTYTFYLYAATDTSNTVAVDTSGAISLRLSPLPDQCPADLNNDNALNFFDISTFIKLQPDFNNDGEFNFFDISAFIAAFSQGCNP